MKKVLHAVGIMNRGGQETYLMNVLRNIDRSQIEFYFQCTHHEKGDYDDEIIALDAKLRYLPVIKYKSLFKYVKKICDLINYFQTNGTYDFYEIHTYHAFDALCSTLGAKLGGQKNIIVHSHNTQGEHKLLHKLSRTILHFFKIKRIACSIEAAKWMYGLKWKKAIIIPNGIKVNNFIFNINKRNKIRHELGIENGDVVIGHVGRFEKQKNHSRVLDIFKQYLDTYDSSAKLLLIGEGSLKQKIIDKVKKMNILDSVIILNSQDNINEYMMAMDVFLFPSLYEGLPIVVLEASVSGLPCIISSNITQEIDLNENVKKCDLEINDVEWASKIVKTKIRKNCLNNLFTLDETLKRVCNLYGITYE